MSQPVSNKSQSDPEPESEQQEPSQHQQLPSIKQLTPSNMLAVAASFTPHAAKAFHMPRNQVTAMAQRLSTSAGPVQRTSWSTTWSNLSPKTRRNVKALAALGVVIDTAVLLNYQTVRSWFIGKEQKQ